MADKPESWNTREFCLRAANDETLYQWACEVLRRRRKRGQTSDLYKPNGVRVWAQDVAESYTPKLRVTQVAVRAALRACDPGIDLRKFPV